LARFTRTPHHGIINTAMSSIASSIRNLWPFGPIFASELQQMSRRKRSYVLRVGYLALLLSILALGAVSMNTTYARQDQSVVMLAERQATLGRSFFVMFALFSVAAMHLIGPVLSSTSIGSERLRRTLDVLLMTPITSWQIVGGKLFSRVLGALILIGLTLPVLAIVRLLGGVELSDMLGLTTLAVATALGSTAIGLWLSSHINRAWAVILLAYMLQLAVYFFVPLIIWMFVALGMWGSTGRQSQSVVEFWMTVMSATNPMWTTIIRVSPSGMSQFASWWPAIIGQLLLTTALMFLATRAVRKLPKEQIVTHDVTPPAPVSATETKTETETQIETETTDSPPPVPLSLVSTSPLSSHFTSALPVQRVTALAKHRAISDNPVRWREMLQPMLPRKWQRRVATYTTLGLLGLTYFGLGFLGALDQPELHIAYMFCFQTLLLMIAVVFSATCIANEKESDTWTLIIASPLSGREIVYGKFFGVLRRLKWPMILTASHLLVFTIVGIVSPVATFLSLLVVITFTLPWVVLGIYFSLACKRVTTAVVLNLLTPMGAFMVVPLMLAFVDIIQRGITGNSSRLSELTYYYLPYYWIGTAIIRLSSNFDFYDITMPVVGVRIDVISFTFLTFGFCAIGAVVTYLGLKLLSRRFNKIVGRADG